VCSIKKDPLVFIIVPKDQIHQCSFFHVFCRKSNVEISQYCVLLLEERFVLSSFANYHHSLDDIHGYFDEFMEPWLPSSSGFSDNGTVIFAAKLYFLILEESFKKG